MNKFVLLIFISFLLISPLLWRGAGGEVFAQINVYHPFPDSNAVWSILTCNTPPPTCDTYWYNIKGDTVLNSKTYHKLNRCDSNGVKISVAGGIREDSINKKIYFFCLNPMNAACSNTSSEKILYNFDAAIGDTIHYSSGYGAWTLTSIDSIQLLDGTYRKKYNTSSCFNSPFIIEGIGSGAELLYGCYNTGPGMYTLLCFKQNKVLLYMEPMNNTCYAHTVDVQDVNVNSSLFSISPNPSTGIFTIISSEKFQFSVYDVFGRAIYKSMNPPINQSTTVDLSSYSKGIYFVRGKSNDKIFSKKIILQ